MTDFNVTYRVKQEILTEFLGLANELGTIREVVPVAEVEVEKKPARTQQRPHMSSTAILRVRASNGAGTLSASGRAAVAYLREHGPTLRNRLTRALARGLELKPNSVSALLSNLVADHWIEEQEPPPLKSVG